VVKTALTLALALSVLINIVLLRRGPAATPTPTHSPATPASPALRPKEIPTDTLLLQEENRVLRNQRTVAEARAEIDRNPLGLRIARDLAHPDAREMEQLTKTVVGFIENRQVGARDRQGRLVMVHQRVLTPERRHGALGAIEDYLGLEDASRRSFRDGAQAAVDAYHRISEANELERLAAENAVEHDEYFEDAARRNQGVWDRMSQRHEQWNRDHVQPLRDFLDRRDGVRPALLRPYLADLLMRLGGADER